MEFKLEHHRALQAEKNGMYHVAVQNYLHCLSNAQSINDSGMTSLFAVALERCYANMNMFDKAAGYARLSLVQA